MLYISALTLFSKQNIFATREYLIFLLELCYIAKKMFYVIDQNFTLCHRFVQFSMFCIKIRLICVCQKVEHLQKWDPYFTKQGKNRKQCHFKFWFHVYCLKPIQTLGGKIRKKITFETINGDFFKFQPTKFQYTYIQQKKTRKIY